MVWVLEGNGADITEAMRDRVGSVRIHKCRTTRVPSLPEQRPFSAARYLVGMSQGSDAAITIEPLRTVDDGITEAILRSLPDWFGIEEAILMYIADATRDPTFVARAGGVVAGFITLRTHFPHAAEIHCMAVRPEFHRRGVGRAMVEFAATHLRSQGVRFMQVKTMGESKPNREYDMTRRFYLSVGFTPIEEFKGFWKGLPALLLIQAL
jgi:ribosomal protein S18 acetylase RimI-like enzyme